MADPTLWVAVSFLGFLGLLLYFKVPAAAAKALDDRAEAISKELDEARRLRDEAQALYAEYERRQRDAEKEAESIVTQAEAEAERLAAETKVKLDLMLERRTAHAEDKIARAEAQALDEVRLAASATAVKVAEKLIGDSLTKKKAESLISASIKELPSKLN
ncbi:MAG: F0F1 ATP synthase subunit B [Hyphomicrobiales bacterium]|nr:MAG: F0F1 ATP synthase subunit B [Hyphomicrobiales bacterium]